MITSTGYNLSSNASCALTGTADLQNTPAKLYPLRNNGGTLLTRVPRSPSAAVDSGRPGCSGTDERGLPRPQDGDGDSITRCDRGSVELGPPNPLALTVNSTLDKTDANAGDGVCQTSTPGECTLRAALMETNAWSGQDTITLDPVTYTLTVAGQGEDGSRSGDLDVNDDLTMNGNGATIDGNLLDTALQTQLNTDLIATGLTITRGALAGASSAFLNKGTATLNGVSFVANGAGSKTIGNDGTLTLEHATVADNPLSGGIVSTTASRLTMVDSAVANNASSAGVRGLTVGGTATITRSTISGNQTGGLLLSGAGATATITTSTISNNGINLRPRVEPC